MKTIEITDLPEGAEIVGRIDDDPSMVYASGDVLYVVLPNGAHVDLGYDEDDAEHRFVITVWVGFFGNNLREYRTNDHDDAVRAVEMFAWGYAKYTTDELIAATITNTPEIRRLYEIAEEIDRLFSWDIAYASLASLGCAAIGLCMYVGSNFGLFVLTALTLPCMVVSNVYFALMEKKIKEANAMILHSEEDS